MTKKSLIFLLIFSSIILLTPCLEQTAEATQYYYYDLGAGSGSIAHGINDQGQIVGVYYPGGYTTPQAFTWTLIGGLNNSSFAPSKGR